MREGNGPAEGLGIAASDLAFDRRYPVARPPVERATRTADGLLIVLVVDDIDAEYERLTAAGTSILTPIETEEWGARYFQVEDPNGVIVQPVQWVAAPPESVTAS